MPRSWVPDCESLKQRIHRGSDHPQPVRRMTRWRKD